MGKVQVVVLDPYGQARIDAAQAAVRTWQTNPETSAYPLQESRVYRWRNRCYLVLAAYGCWDVTPAWWMDGYGDRHARVPVIVHGCCWTVDVSPPQILVYQAYGSPDHNPPIPFEWTLEWSQGSIPQGPDMALR